MAFIFSHKMSAACGYPLGCDAAGLLGADEFGGESRSGDRQGADSCCQYTEEFFSDSVCHVFYLLEPFYCCGLFFVFIIAR